MYGFAGTGDARGSRGATYGGSGGLFPMIHQDVLHVWVTAENLNQLGPTVASITDDSDRFHV
jgi:hypothetical protein